MHARRLLTALALIAALALPACAGRAPEKAPEKSAEKGDKKGNQKEKESDPVQEGTKKMRSELDELRAAVNANDQAGARKSAQALDETWEKIEGKVRSRDADAYDRVERPLHAVISGVGVSPLDQAVVGDQIDVLDEQLAQLGKSKQSGGTASKKVDIRIGAAAMRYNLQAVNQALEKDTAAAQKAAKDADEAWEKFQGDVKKQDEEAYKKIEEAMHNLMAAVNASPLDKQKAKENIPKLDAQLAELLK